MGKTSSLKDRVKEDAIPTPLDVYLTAEQLASIRKMEGFAYELYFVRRPLFQDTVTIMKHHSTGHTILIDQDGSIIKDHDIVIR